LWVHKSVLPRGKEGSNQEQGRVAYEGKNRSPYQEKKRNGRVAGMKYRSGRGGE